MGKCSCCNTEGPDAGAESIGIAGAGRSMLTRPVCRECKGDILDVKSALIDSMHPMCYGLVHHALKDMEPRMKPIMVAVPNVGWILMGFVPDVKAIDKGEPAPHVAAAIEAYARGILGIEADEEPLEVNNG